MSITILLVEDNDLNRDMLSRRLSRRGFNVITAVNGEEAIEMANGNQPDVILMDMGLPIIDGWQATETIKANTDTQHIPIIALTAHAMDEDRQRATDVGCDDFDTKPIDLARLVGKIEAIIK